jgi:hypothetical protein
MTAYQWFRMYVIWAITLTWVSVNWISAEAAQPGQQYADPAFATLYCSVVLACPIVAADMWIQLVRDSRRARKGRAAHTAAILPRDVS